MDVTYELLLRFIPSLADAPSWVLVAIAAGLPALACFGFMSVGPIVYVYGERKISGFMQDRLGPMRVGKWGLLQTIADSVKLLFKEAIFPRDVDRKLFLLAPIIVCVGAFLPLVVIPWGGRLQGADLNVGVFFIAAISSLSVIGLIMAGWASNNKYALFGGMRSAAQIVSYEIPAVMLLLVPVMIAGSLSMQDLVAVQAGGLQNWLLFRYFPLMPIAFVTFFVAGMAECNRTPFDIPEAESELVAGFHTEYSGFFFAMFMMAEYTEMFVISAVSSVLFLGGYPDDRTRAPRLVLAHLQVVVADLRDDVAALDAPAPEGGPAHARRVEGAPPHRLRARHRDRRAHPLAGDRKRLPLGSLRGMAADGALRRVPDRGHGAGAAMEPAPGPGAGGIG
jgi:NADH-quinone oxidoreductase subunit H